MGRTVSTPSNAIAVVYAYCASDEDPDIAQMNWDDDVENLRSGVLAKLRDSVECDKWCGREDRAIVEDDFGYVGISEYCGIVSFWAVPKDIEDEDDIGRALERAPKRKRWHERIGKVLFTAAKNALGEKNIYRKVGTFSNGEGVYERVKPKRRRRTQEARV